MAFSYYGNVGRDFSVPQLANDILRYAYGKPVLARPEICPIISIPRLHIRQPILGQLIVNMGIRELESIGIQNPTSGHKDIELLNDRIAVQVSVESQIENYYGDSMEMIAADKGRALAKALEIWIATAMQQTPLKLETTAQTIEQAAQRWHMHVIPHAIQLLEDWDPTAVCMSPVLWAKLQAIFTGATKPDGANYPYEWADYRIPGLDCPVVTSRMLPVDKMFVVSAEAPAMRCYQHDEMRPYMQYDPKTNANTMYTGIWRTVASNFRTAVDMPQWTNTGVDDPLHTQTGNAGVIEIKFTGGGYLHAGVAGDSGDDPDETVRRQNKALYEMITRFAGQYIADKMQIVDRSPTIESAAYEDALLTAFGTTRDTLRDASA